VFGQPQPIPIRETEQLDNPAVRPHNTLLAARSASRLIPVEVVSTMQKRASKRIPWVSVINTKAASMSGVGLPTRISAAAGLRGRYIGPKGAQKRSSFGGGNV